VNVQSLKKNKTLRIVKLLYVPAVFVCIVFFAWSNREILAKMLVIADIRAIVTAVILWTSLHLLAPLSPKIIFSGFNIPISYQKLLAIHISRLPARYLPGGIWHTVGRMADYHSYGVSRKQLTILMLIETFFPCLITLSLGGGYLYFVGNNDHLFVAEGVFAGVSLISLLVIPVLVKLQRSTWLYIKFANFYILLISLSVIFWVVAAVSFLFYYSSVLSVASSAELVKIAASYIFSWGIGYISIFAPQGIGVLEVVAGKLMELPMDFGSGIAFLAGFRLIALAADVLASLAYYIHMVVKQTFFESQEDKGPGSGK